MRLCIVSDIRSLDPASVYDWLEGALGMMIHCPLLDFGDDEELIPKLAAALPEVSDDGITYTFRLRPDIRFSDGKPVEIADVFESLERHLDPESGSLYATYFQNIEGHAEFTRSRKTESETRPADRPPGRRRWIEPVHLAGLKEIDPRTIQIRLTRPDPIFPLILASPFAGIVPRDEVQRQGRSFAQRPVGAGPFLLTEWVRGIRIRLARNPHFFIPGEPWLDGVEVSIGINEAAEQMMFERGELDVVSKVAPADLIRAQREPYLRSRLRTMPGISPTYIALNCEIPPLNDVRVRQALNYAVDKERVLKALNHRGVVAHGALPPTVKGFNPDMTGYPYNPDTARALLRQAGVPDGFAIEFWVGDTHTWRQLAPIVQQDLAQVGIRAELKPVNGLAQYAAQERGKVPMSVWDWMANFNDPKDTLDTLLNGEKITDTACLNTAFYSNPRVNELFRRADSERDPDRRIGLFQEAEKIIVQEAPWIFLYHDNRYQLRQPWLRSTRSKVRALWPERYERCWIEREPAAEPPGASRP